ncbi:cell wall-active antibiotics response protein LiaF [Sporolactobacillus inulinus]|uniref:Cell wall-active antibiotics response LiaF-like C-terminal domain-containing protein n=1 Tax=Sporolactobacillus inulinus CASD TaxID=1069536 RepID=A0A0U1QNV6_9BACL|nr:cell wall-active antibiotics response protein LiaF [Sporolactobacillus inulinus]KLI02462.1 hypothetical protein SINU_07975 [Sporolactobacillus inulinus CASD]GEB75791.1 hypothetical protein SIN01_01360 [Sporolactobacillus inulinus]
MGKILAAFAVILLGVYWLLASLNSIPQGIMSNFDFLFPVLSLVFAALLIVAPLFEHKKSHWFWGGFFLIYGGLLYADQARMLIFHWSDFWKLWPYLIIYAGLSMLFGKKVTVSYSGKHKHKHGKPHIEFVNDDNRHWQNGDRRTREAFVNESSYKQENWMVKPITERVRIGDYTFDFTKAFIPDETIPIRLSGWVGNIRITLPDDLPYRVHVHAKVGDVKIGGDKQSGLLRHVTYQTPSYDEATRRIDFYFDFQVIDLSIAQV